MGRAPGVVVHADKQELADAVADRLVTTVVDAQSSRGIADVVLTGGSMGSAVLQALGSSPGRDAIDWSAVRLWWGDERFLPGGDADRNETQAREALLDRLDLPREHVLVMAASDSGVASAEEAADRYAEQLAAVADPGESVPRFDVLMLGVGPDAHVASLFPGHPALYERDRPVVAVHGSPKPPPTRVSLTFPALCHARDVWFMVSGADKADAVGLALSGAGEMQAPAAGVHGTRSTLWLVDRPAAQHVPQELVRIASP
ncbi:MAG TPA: 6-phosphogluconolactonase [Segeticoccus sp.]|uniref:6-phosphogluconolactonase n=1 Tax=Segeticoccus sp. TaxID=2706531 RepID=UPI002D7E7B2C|nr:6-phosphogluconolactonase [Segeticoccus sp.]HET8600245.1 6-phosphogluconolactonase [Segeticoccus sp.]